MDKISTYVNSFFGVVTSMCLDGNRLFVGKGNYLLTYNIILDKLDEYIKIFDSNKILKIKLFNYSNSKYIILLAETQIKFSIIDNNQISTLSFTPIKTLSNEYAIDSLLYEYNNEVYIIIGYINNYINIFKLSQINKITLIKTVFSPSKCIVYSMGLYNDKNSILIASGTVFRKVTIWEVLKSSLEKSELSLSLTGHEGVIFSAHFITNDKLVSTSDDRTTRYWEFDRMSLKFSSKIFFGHSSRVWDSVTNWNKGLVVSISEDATGRVYDIHNSKFLFELNNGHLGKNIRSVEINDEYIFTGGEDGQIIKWKIKQKNINEKIENINLLGEYILNKKDEQNVKAAEKQKNFNPSIKAIKFLNEYTLLIATNHGCLLSFDIQTNQIKETLFVDKEIRVINTIDIINRQFIFVGLSNGHIQFIDINNNTKNNICIKIFHNIRIPFINHKYFSISKELFIIISTALGKSKVYYIKKELSSITFDDIYNILNPNTLNCVEINTGGRFPIGISSFEIVKHSNEYNKYIIYLGDFEGRLYYTKITQMSSCLFNFNSDVKYLHIHNNDKITQIIFSYNQVVLYTFSRDGKMKKFYEINTNNKNFSIKEIDSKFRSDISSNEICLYDSIENFENGKFFIIGHHGRYLLIFNALTNLIIHSNDVKGVNRPLDVIFTSSLSNLLYASSQADTVKIFKVCIDDTIKSNDKKGNLVSYKEPIHGRVIHSISIKCVNRKKEIYLVCTGSEDTKVNLYLITNKDELFMRNYLKYIGQFTRHECAIRKIKIIKVIYDEKDDNIINEVIFISIASKCEAFIFKVIIDYDKVKCDIYLLYDLNYFSNDKSSENTRNMDCYISEISDVNYVIYITNTISITSVYNIIFNEGYTNLKVNVRYIKNTTSNFIALCICSIDYEDKTYLLYGQTNGKINIVNEKANVDLYYKIHEAGINDIKYIIIKDKNNCIIFSCGEDCTICISELDLKGGRGLSNILKVNKSIHFSAIKSLFIKRISNEEVIIISGSYDQLVNICSYNISSNTMKRIKKINCCVSEINSISAENFEIDNNNLLVCAVGQGMEFYNISLNL